MEQVLLPTDRPILSIGELNYRARHLLEQDPALRDVWVRGEVSNYRGPHVSGHAYFRLKDEEAEIDVVCWRDTFARLAFAPQEGLGVLVRGHPTVYEARGRYQFIIEEMLPAGEGALALQLQLLKRKLEAEGLFAPGRKRPIPRFARVVGVVTSAGSAAFRDVLNVLARRSPHVEVLLADARVQGAGAGEEVARAIERLNEHTAAGYPLDVILVVRGGGSLEDLWAFNEEVAVRAVVASRVPIISGVGHETDWTLIDFAADVRAPTPSAAAEVAAPSREALLLDVDELRERAGTSLTRTVGRHRLRLDKLSHRAVLTRPQALFASAWQTKDDLATRLPRAMQVRVDRAGARLRTLADRSPRALAVHVERTASRFARTTSMLDALSPLKVLARGYAVAMADGFAVRSVAQVKKGARLDVLVTDGHISTEVLSTREGPP